MIAKFESIKRCTCMKELNDWINRVPYGIFESLYRAHIIVTLENVQIFPLHR